MSRKQVIILVAFIVVCLILARHGGATPLVCTPIEGTTDTCKEGECAGYPDGICESNPELAKPESQKDYTEVPDPNRHYFDLDGNEFDAMGHLVKPVAKPTVVAPDEQNNHVVVDDTPGTGK